MIVNENQAEINKSDNNIRRPEIRWNYAIKEASKRIEELEDSIKAFERYRDAGEPFLGEIPESELEKT